jgi:glycerophosphoryl diester phosphodiesterase
VARPRTGFPFLDRGLDHPGTVLAFAHRGGSFHPEIEGLENTLVAFQHAVDLGYQHLETDVNLTRDGVLLAFHDAVLDRVTEGTGALQDRTHAEIADVLIHGRESIPTLAALLESFPDVCFNIDLKSEAAVDPLADLIAATASRDRVCVGAFSHARVRRFRARAGPRVPTAASPAEVALCRVLPGARAVGRLTCAAAALQVPHRRGRFTVATAGLVERAHALGKHVHVWTVDDPQEMHDLLDRGVDGLFTDRTDLLRDVLLERGQWAGATP